MLHAKDAPCQVLMYPTDPQYDEGIRHFQGCPTVAVTRGGRVWAGWYSGGTREPHMENYNLLTYSDNGGKHFEPAVLVIPSSKERFVQALDIQLWVDPNGCLHVFWVQNDTHPAPEIPPERNENRIEVVVDGYLFNDFTHAMWEMVCNDPDATKPTFSEPRYMGNGFLRCKPTVLANGAWLYCNYDQLSDRYGYSLSYDGGKTLERHYGAEKLETPFDETMVYQRRDGSVYMLARTRLGEIGEAVSCDNGLTWTAAKLNGITHPNTRLYVSRTPSGKLLLVKNDDAQKRTRMTVCLSEDDGKTWAHQCCIDARDSISYPDVDFFGDTVYLIYDRERTGAKEILMTSFCEADIVNGTVPAPWIISKP